jgi:threonine dehydrogenase-like Zn-dependent dehydrogenase
VAADFSSTRRQLALAMGAHHVVDPAQTPSFDGWAAHGGGRPPVVFEAVGVPGMIDDVLRWAPHSTRVVVVGVCMGADRITPFWAISKEINLQFVLGYDPQEFDQSLQSIAEGQIEVAPLITGEVPLEEVPEAFAALADPERHCKILVVPSG